MSAGVGGDGFEVFGDGWDQNQDSHACLKVLDFFLLNSRP